MDFKENLSKINILYNTELSQILTFVNSIEEFVVDKHSLKFEKTTEDRVEAIELCRYLSDFAEVGGQGRSFEIKSENLTKILVNYLSLNKNIKFLMEMSLSYLITHQEAMLKDYLFSIFVHRKETLKTKKEKITYDELIDASCHESLVEYITQIEVDKLGNGSIKDAQQKFLEKFKIDFAGYHCWEDIVEATYRRNIFVHNKGITNDKYCKEVGYSNKNEKLDVDPEYLKTAAKNLIGFNDFCYDEIIKHFKLV